MATDIERLVLQVSADLRGVEKSLDRMSAKVNGSTRAVERRFDTMNARVTRAGQAMATNLAAAIGTIGLGLAIRETAEYADAWTTARNRLAAAGIALEEVAAVQNRLVDLSVDTRTGLNETVELYSRLTRSTQQLGVSQEEVYRVTQTLNQAFKAGGAAASEQRSAILQLSQGLQANNLAGEELRAIRENAPLVARAIAAEFGVTIGALKQLGAEGELTTDRIFSAILNAGDEIEKQFAVTDATIADSFTNLQTSLTRFIGNLDGQIGASQNVGNFLNGLRILAEGAADALGDPVGPLDERILQELERSVEVLGDYGTKVEEVIGSEQNLTREQVERVREQQRTGAYQKQQQIERLNALRDELAIEKELQENEIRNLARRRARGDGSVTDREFDIARETLANIIKNDEALGVQIARAAEAPAAAFLEAAENLAEGAGEVETAFRGLNLREYATDMEKLQASIGEVTSAYNGLAAQVERANAAQARALENDDGSDDALTRIRSTAQAASELQAQLNDFSGSRALVQAIIEYGRASQDIAGAVAELDKLAGVITTSDAGLAMRELRQISEDLTAQILEGEDRILADFQNKVDQIEAARSSAIAVGISDVGQFERAIASAHTELTRALNALYEVDNPFAEPDLSYLQADLPEYEAIGQRFRDIMRDSVKNAMREGIQTDDWGTAFRGILADAIVSAMDDALNRLGDFLADFFFGANGQQGFFGFAASAVTYGGGRAGGGPMHRNSWYNVNEQGAGEVLFLGKSPAQMLTADQFRQEVGVGRGGSTVNISAPLIVQGSIDHMSRTEVLQAMDQNNRQIIRRLPGAIDARVNDSIVNRRLRRS